MPKLRYNLMLNPAVVSRIDVYAEERDISRSEAINEILYDFCNDNDIYNYESDKILNQLEFSEDVVL